MSSETGNPGPFRGLTPFDATDTIYGRDHDVGAVCINIYSSRLTLLYGPSGAGKTSLLKAKGGVLWRIAQDGRRTLDTEDNRPVYYPKKVETGSSRESNALEAAHSNAREFRSGVAIVEQDPNDAASEGDTGHRFGLPIYVDRWDVNVHETLCTAVIECLGEAGIDISHMAKERFSKIISHVAERSNVDLYFILDQFESYFVNRESKDKDPDPEGYAASQIADVICDKFARTNFVFSFRDDWLSRMDEFKYIIPNLFSNSLRINHLDRKSAEEAILSPIIAFDKESGEASAINIVSEVLDQLQILSQPPEIERRVKLKDQKGALKLSQDIVKAPYLQLVMKRLWQEAHREKAIPIDQDLLDKVGQQANPKTGALPHRQCEAIIQEHVTLAMNKLSTEHQKTAAKVFDFMVTPSGVKIPQDVVTLSSWTREPQDAIELVLDELSEKEASICTRVSLAGSGGPARYEVLHDVLVAPIREWRDAITREEETRIARKNAETEVRARERARRRRRIRIALGGAGCLCAVATAFVGYQLRKEIKLTNDLKNQTRVANLQTELADSQRVIAESQREIAESKSQLLAVKKAELEKKQLELANAIRIEKQINGAVEDSSTVARLLESTDVTILAGSFKADVTSPSDLKRAKDLADDASKRLEGLPPERNIQAITVLVALGDSFSDRHTSIAAKYYGLAIKKIEKGSGSPVESNMCLRIAGKLDDIGEPKLSQTAYQKAAHYLRKSGGAPLDLADAYLGQGKSLLLNSVRDNPTPESVNRACKSALIYLKKSLAISTKKAPNTMMVALTYLYEAAAASFLDDRALTKEASENAANSMANAGEEERNAIYLACAKLLLHIDDLDGAVKYMKKAGALTAEQQKEYDELKKQEAAAKRK